jgi:dolichol-phosphate mannosyltransferase
VKNMSSTIANGIRRAFTHDRMDDTGCPLKVIKTDFAKRIPMFKGLHRFLPAMILLQNGKVLQVPVQHFPRIAGTAKYGLWNRLFGPLMDCFAYLWMKKKYINYEVKSKG